MHAVSVLPLSICVTLGFLSAFSSLGVLLSVREELYQALAMAFCTFAGLLLQVAHKARGLYFWPCQQMT